jgi:hypothetical protein
VRASPRSTATTSPKIEDEDDYEDEYERGTMNREPGTVNWERRTVNWEPQNLVDARL